MTEVDPARLVGERYVLVREIGHGGMGVVYLGRDRRRDMDVAIKLCAVEHREAALWLKREFRAVASLRHANLVELYELVAHDGGCYFTMEHVAGQDPRRWCGAPVDFARVRVVIAQLAEALAFLHARGVIHRDVKPGNAIVTDAGALKLLDFGLALQRHRANEELARENRVVGTAAYLAPEYLERLEVTPALDIYALGVLAFELATGAPPFGGTLHVLARLHRAMSIPRATALEPRTPPELDALIAEMLAADPAARPTAPEVAARLGGGRARPPRGAASLDGRAEERARLTACLADRAPRGRLVVLRGPSGAGKTALIDAACASVHAPIWRGRCHDRERLPYRAFDAIVDDLATAIASDPARADGLAHPAALARMFPAFAAVLAPELLSAPPAGDLRVERERAQLALVQLLGSLPPPLVLVIDDLQWADAASLELLALLVERIDRPLAVIASWTTVDAHVALDGLLARLGTFAEAIDVPALATDDAPALLARLARLAPAERAIADVAAVADGPTTFDQLRALAALPSGALLSALRGLEDERVMRATPSPSGDPVYVFYHQRLRDAAHAALAAEARQALHERFARHLEAAGADASALAYHWEHAGDGARAVRWTIAAADDARARLAWDLAATGYARALALGGADGGLRAQLAECLALAGKLEDAAREYLVLAGDVAAGDRWRVRAAEANIKLGEIERGLALLDPVLARHGQPRASGRATSLLRAARVAATWVSPRRARTNTNPPDDVLAAAHGVLAKFLSTPYPVEALEYVLRDARDAAGRGDRAGASTGMAMIAAYLAAGTLGRFGDRALVAAGRLSGAPYPAMVTAGCAGIVSMLRGDWGAMRAQHATGEQICRELGLERSWEASFLRSYWALGEHYAGEPARAIAMLGELAGASDDLISRALLGSHRARALLVAGELEAARGIEAEIRRTPAARHGMAAIYRQVLAGELALADHDWARAAALARELAGSARAQWLTAMPAVSAMIDVIDATAALGLARGGDARAAMRAREVARRLHRRGRTSFYAPTALRLWAQAEALRGRAGASRDLLARAAVDAARRGGAVDRLAIATLRGEPVELGALASAVSWSTAGAVGLRTKL